MLFFFASPCGALNARVSPQNNIFYIVCALVAWRLSSKKMGAKYDAPVKATSCRTKIELQRGTTCISTFLRLKCWAEMGTWAKCLSPKCCNAWSLSPTYCTTPLLNQHFVGRHVEPKRELESKRPQMYTKEKAEPSHRGEKQVWVNFSLFY